MKENQKIAVVIPAYNEERLIGATIRSVPLEVSYIVVVDDCSKDNTVGEVESEKSTDSRVVLIQHEKIRA